MTDIFRDFKDMPFRVEKRYSKQDLPFLPSCFKPTLLGEPKIGILGQYRCGLLHAYEFPHYWLIHKDEYNPETHPVEHLAKDAPHWGLIAAIGAAVVIKKVADWLTSDN